MNSYKAVLQSLGLSKYESKVYMTLLECGPCSPSDIEKTSNLLRPVVYKALSNLISKNLVAAQPKGKRKLYTAQSPDRLVEIFRGIEDGFLSTIEDLHTIHRNPQSRPGSSRPEINYSEGDKAVRAAYMDIIDSLDKGGTYYRYSPGHELFDRKRFLPKAYRQVRDQKQLERYIIIDETKAKPNNNLGRAFKTIPKSFDLFKYRIGLFIYKDKVTIIDYESGGVITITHSKFAEFQKSIFKLLYSKL